MNRVIVSTGWLAVEVIGHAGILGMHSATATGPVWLLVGAMTILISVRRVADEIFARITREDETLPLT
ncbi:MAG: hypothetical protein AB7I48_16700 [Planctomycetaceae bacterium]